ncbi:hypothetical protein ACFQT0_02250 [Hymenobacter humi]|uniref:Uncharacterized protein n=1 Tax=Hymenobacter humi TaxID=1411620 RepID=A0ABW2TYS2_9BACT
MSKFSIPSKAVRCSYPLLLGVLLLSAACKKEDPEATLPRISQEGLNTGGFLVDGVAYPATGWSAPLLSTFNNGAAALEGGYYIPWPGLQARNEYELRINSEQAKKYVTVTLYLRNPGVGDFVLNRDTGLPPSAVDSTIFDHAIISFRTSNGEIYTTSAIHTGRITMSRANRPSFSLVPSSSRR